MTRLVLGLTLIALPMLELALLIKTGQAIGFWATLALLVAAAVIGGAIMSRQGISVARRTQEAIAQGRPPVGPVLDGAFLFLAGALLISPGFITDVHGNRTAGAADPAQGGALVRAAPGRAGTRAGRSIGADDRPGLSDRLPPPPARSTGR